MKEAFISRFIFCVAIGFLLNSCEESEDKISPNQNVTQSPESNSKQAELKENPLLPAPLKTPLDFYSKSIHIEDTSFNLTLPKGWDIRVVKEGFGRLRFLSKSPDNRLFVTDMKNRSDNSKGKVLILEGFDKVKAEFDTCITYLDQLRNPNNTAFHTDSNAVTWLYVALTQKLVRCKYIPGETSPSSTEEVIAEFPDYGLSYKYGGWHLTRTVAIHDEKVYVSVGSSCNACEEKEPVRASILKMDLDGKNVNHYAYGVRNAVDINWINGKLYSTNMGADHLGDDAPDEALYQVSEGSHYGWPYFYQFNGEIVKDTSQQWIHDTLNAADIPMALAELGGHSAPLGFEFFQGDTWPESIRNYFLVALHGSGYVRIGNGYSLVRVAEGLEPEPVITGWLKDGHRFGRPTDVFIYDENSFFITDDHNGVLYYVEIKE